MFYSTDKFTIDTKYSHLIAYLTIYITHLVIPRFIQPSAVYECIPEAKRFLSTGEQADLPDVGNKKFLKIYITFSLGQSGRHKGFGGRHSNSDGFKSSTINS